MKRHFFNLQKYIFLLTSIVFNSYAIFDSHFFHAGYLWNEPRFQETLLATYSLDMSGDTTTRSRNSNGTKVPLFDLYGFSNLYTFARSIPDLDPNNPLEKIILDVANLPSRNCFGLVSFDGFFELMRFNFKMYQNLSCGFFGGFEIPVFQFNSAVTSVQDLSPRDNNQVPSAQTQEWKKFLGALDGILTHVGLRPQVIDETNTGDTIIVFGYASNNDENFYLDLIDYTITLGGLIPTGRQTNPDNPFDIPTGYNGFFGMGASFDGAIGLWDWVTLAFHADYLGLLQRTKELRIKSDYGECGLIKFKKTFAQVKPGNIWRVGPFFKADHVLGGFSVLFGYSYEQKNKSCITQLCPFENETALSIANTDPMFDGFSQHNFHLLVEYDASTDQQKLGPRVSFFLNHSIFGKRIFITNIKGGYVGLDVSWSW